MTESAPRPGPEDLERAGDTKAKVHRAETKTKTPQEAKRQGVRVYTVGVGTSRDPRTFRSGYFGVLDEPTLRAIATETGGEYFRAAEAGRLRQIYRHLARTIGWERKSQEVAAVAGGIALLCLVAAVVLRSGLAPMADVGARVK